MRICSSPSVPYILTLFRIRKRPGRSNGTVNLLPGGARKELHSEAFFQVRERLSDGGFGDGLLLQREHQDLADRFERPRRRLRDPRLERRAYRPH